eukprot:1056760-Prorocentrum_minimum.AAC.1
MCVCVCVPSDGPPLRHFAAEILRCVCVCVPSDGLRSVILRLRPSDVCAPQGKQLLRTDQRPRRAIHGYRGGQQAVRPPYLRPCNHNIYYNSPPVPVTARVHTTPQRPVQTRPDPSRPVQTRPDPSRPVQTRPDPSRP